MRSSLTETNRVDPERGHIAPYEWSGRTVEVCDSARNILAVLAAFRDPEAAQEAVGSMLFLDFADACYAAAAAPGGYLENLSSLVCDVLWDVCALDVTHDRRHSESWEEPRFSWEEDAGRIKASLLAAYGIRWDDTADSTSFADMCSLLSGLMEMDLSTPFREAVKYRGNPPEHIRNDPKMMEAWRKAAAIFAMPEGDPADAMEAANDAMASLFAAAERAAV